MPVLVLHEQAFRRAVGLVPVHHRDIRGLQTFGENVEFGLLLQAARDLCAACRASTVARNPLPPKSTATDAGGPGRSNSPRRCRCEEARAPPVDARPVARYLWVALHVVDDAKPIPQRVDELPVDVVASASVDPWSRLYVSTSTRRPRATSRRRSRRVRRGRGRLDEVVQQVRHGGRCYTSVENNPG